MSSKSNENYINPKGNRLGKIETSEGINYNIKSYTAKDTKEDVVETEEHFSNCDTEAKENLPVVSNEAPITKAKREICKKTGQYLEELYSNQVIQQNKMLCELNTACEGIFQLDREMSVNESGAGLKTPLSEEVVPCVAARKSDFKQTFVLDTDEEQTVDTKKEQCSPKENECVLEIGKLDAKDETQTHFDENPSKETCKSLKQAFDENKILQSPQNSNVFRGNLVQYTTERLEDIARRNYEAARAVFKSKENQGLQNASLEIAIKNIFSNKADTKKELEKVVNDEDFSILYQSSITEELNSHKNKRQESSISFDSWQTNQTMDASKKTSYSDYMMDSTKIRKTVKRPVPQISDRVSFKQLVTPEGLEESREKKVVVRNARKENGNELTAKKKLAALSYEDLMRVLASPTSESSIFTDATKTKVADGLHSSPSDSRLLKSEQRAAAAAAERKKESAPKVKNLEEELHYHNPFQTVFRRAGFTDVNMLYRFMDYEGEEDFEELEKPLPQNYIEDLIKKIQNTDKQLRTIHKEMFEGGLMRKFAPYAMCKKMRDGIDSEDEESSSEEGDSTDK